VHHHTTRQTHQVLQPKRVVIATLDAAAAAPPGQLGTAAAPPDAGFCAPSLAHAATVLWEGPLAAAGPPLFRKMRQRDALDAAGAAGDALSAEAAAGLLWNEIALQGWRTELDYGLGKHIGSSSSSSGGCRGGVLVLKRCVMG